MTETERRALVELSILDLPFAQRLLFAALDLLLAVEAAPRLNPEWWDPDMTDPWPPITDAATSMRAVLAERQAELDEDGLPYGLCGECGAPRTTYRKVIVSVSGKQVVEQTCDIVCPNGHPQP